jgi:hypothetical protein
MKEKRSPIIFWGLIFFGVITLISLIIEISNGNLNRYKPYAFYAIIFVISVFLMIKISEKIPAYRKCIGKLATLRGMPFKRPVWLLPLLVILYFIYWLKTPTWIMVAAFAVIATVSAQIIDSYKKK